MYQIQIWTYKTREHFACDIPQLRSLHISRCASSLSPLKSTTSLPAPAVLSPRLRTSSPMPTPIISSVSASPLPRLCIPPVPQPLLRTCAPAHRFRSSAHSLHTHAPPSRTRHYTQRCFPCSIAPALAWYTWRGRLDAWCTREIFESRRELWMLRNG